MEERRKVKSKVTTENITAEFVAEVYGGPLLDTGVKLEVKDFCITWDNQEKLVNEIQEVLEKYKI